MSVTPSFRAFVVEQLERVAPPIRAKSMFGGVGLYSGETFFALISGDELYLKVDESTRADFEARGLRPFLPYGAGGEAMQYYTINADTLEDVDELRVWVDKALGVARAKRKTNPRPRTKKL